MRIDRLITTCRHGLTDLTNLCLLTALGLSAAAAVGIVVNTFMVSWPQTGFLLAGAGFYLLLGFAYLLRDLRNAAQRQTVLVTTATRQPHSPMPGQESDDYRNEFETSPSELEESRQRQDAMAGV